MAVVASLATIPQRYEYFLMALRSIFSQSCIGLVDRIIVNIDDNLPQSDKDKYNVDTLSRLCGTSFGNLVVMERPAKWKSANKLIWTYKEHHDDIIVCFDDDGVYDSACLKQLLDAYDENSGCIICQQSNPVIIDRFIHRIEYLNHIDVKLKQRGFSKYFSHACLFPPNCFSDLLFDYDKFEYITDCNHDELWFWIVSTLNGVRVVCLDNLGYFYYDYEEWRCAKTQMGLMEHNGNEDNIKRYNERMNELFGNNLLDAIDSHGVHFQVNKQNSYATYVSIPFINQIYRGWNITFSFESDVAVSWYRCICDSISSLMWFGNVKLIKNDEKLQNN